MRSAVVFPQPDGPDEHHELLVADLEAHPRHRARSVGVDLADPVEGHGCHVLGRATRWQAARQTVCCYVTGSFAFARRSSRAVWSS